ncbi:MAG: GNAT family N-acetyltransferase [Tessaracoccus sp.]|uniref:GNAT family N-acetyltransferase n=1 Tax=Tessaracoccus sp. TaxID=1971211 RepID=UPI001EC02E6B|nr:GNAT family N-acetyltransferase [Tessaracoccus sp.]MBK7820794.1 GNAT family N-acetyltransferase [Tessaracoccus sp.]
MTERLRSHRFDPGRHAVAEFSCGEESLDRWLKEQAGVATKRGTARTWVWVDADDRVVGYYALAAHKVARGDIPSKIGRGGPAEVPAVLLARLALSRELRGRGLGAVLVADALERVVAATRTVAARLVVVDALSEPVARFYEALGFRRIPDSLLLVQKIADIEASLESARDQCGGHATHGQ